MSGTGELLLTHQRLFSLRRWISKCNIGQFLAQAAPLCSAPCAAAAAGAEAGWSSAVFGFLKRRELSVRVLRRDTQKKKKKKTEIGDGIALIKRHLRVFCLMKQFCSLSSLCVGVFQLFQAFWFVNYLDKIL